MAPHPGPWCDVTVATTTPHDASLEERSRRAAQAARSVTGLFGARLFGLPGTHLGARRYPRPGRGPWHYWWQAHYLDCLVDSALREGRPGGDAAAAGEAVRSAGQVLRAIWLRNRGRFPNRYADDMAWLALAAQRLEPLVRGRHARPGGTARLAEAAQRAIRPRLEAAHTTDLGGGVFWNDRRDVKNVAASGPTALYLARCGDVDAARAIVDWLYATLFDAAIGLFRDGVHLSQGGPQLDREVYTYNQGTVLGALLQFGDPASRERAAALVDAISGGLTLRLAEHPVLVTHGGHDGGLFSGIAARYLAIAGATPGLPAASRAQARDLVLATADAFWRGRVVLTSPPAGDPGRHNQPRLVFPGDLADPLPPSLAASPVPPGGAELSQQLQAWMALEAAATFE